METVFHEGELAVQKRAGVQSMAARVGNGIKSTIPPAAAQFLTERQFAIMASLDAQDRVWASLLTGGQQFMNPLDEHVLQINPHIEGSDLLFTNLQANKNVGLLAIDFATRRRMRLNGKATWHHDELIIQAEQVYANCPKYIQERILILQTEVGVEPRRTSAKQLSAEQTEWIANADTFFIASAHAEGGVDASHRGGHKGFVYVDGSKRLIWPDYAGNMMFNTLGNIACNPNVGLLFVDFENGRLLQLTGQAKISWDDSEIAQFTGAERLVTFTIDQLIETQPAHHFNWIFASYSPHNPT